VSKHNTLAVRRLTERELADCRAAEKDIQPQIQQTIMISDLVWKYFEEEIREALAEAQQHLDAKAVKINNEPLRGWRRGK
jgi:hypothetical protein